MTDHERATDEAVRVLAELFSDDPSAPPTRTCRKYFLEYQDGEPVFQLAELPSNPTPPRDEIEVAIDEVMVELFGPDPDGNEIVPQKLARLFPGRSGQKQEDARRATDY